MAFYNLKLLDGCSQDEFLSEISIPCTDPLSCLPQLIFFDISAEDAQILRDHSSVEWIEEEPDSIDAMGYNILPENQGTDLPVRRTKDLVVGNTPSSSEDGSTFGGAWKYLSGHLPFTNTELTSSGDPKPPGYFTSDEDRRVDNVNIDQNYTGKYVDVVVVESTTGDEDISTHELLNLPHFKDSLGATRFVATDWKLDSSGNTGTYSSLSSQENNQLQYGRKSFVPYPLVGASLVSGNTITIANHGFNVNLSFVAKYSTSTGQVIPGLVDGNIYWITNPTATSFTLREYQAGVTLSNSTDVTLGATPQSAFSGDHHFDPMILTDHIVSAASQIAGLTTGWAQNATIRMASINDGISTIYNRVLEFHNNKPINPLTGVKNATLTTGGWQFVTQTINRFINPNDIESIQPTGSSGSTINVPSTDGNGRPNWGGNLTSFKDNLIVPKYNASLDYSWGIPLPATSNDNSWNITMNAYNAVEGIYCIKSAGNSGSVFTKRSDSRRNAILNTKYPFTYYTVTYNSSYQPQYAKKHDTIIYDTLGDGADVSLVQGSRTLWRTWTQTVSTSTPALPLSEMTDAQVNTYFSALTIASGWNTGTPPTVRSYNPHNTRASGADHAIEVGACQVSNLNPMPDGYSCRGPGVDIWSFGSSTWTGCSAAEGSTYADGANYKYFSGTSAAAPTCAGMVAIYIEDYFTKRGKYPSTAKLKELLLKYGDTVEGQTVIDWTNTNAETTFTANRFISSTNMYHVTGAVTGTIRISELHGTTNKRAAVPYNIRLSNGKHIADPRGPNHGSRSGSGQTYPRRKIRIGS